MISALRTWGRILSNPFTGYAEIRDGTRVLWPLVCLLILAAVSTTLLLPVTSSPDYFAAALRTQSETLRQRGIEMDDARRKALEDQMASPAMRAFTVASSYVGALASTAVLLLLLALLLKALTAAMKVPVTYRRLLAVVAFTGLVTAVQGLLKAGILLAGDWQGALRAVRTTADLKTALQAPLSLALLAPAGTLGKAAYALLDAATDVFHWIYFAFLYAGMKSVGLEKGRAVAATAVAAALFLGIAVGASALIA